MLSKSFVLYYYAVFNRCYKIIIEVLLKLAHVYRKDLYNYAKGHAVVSSRLLAHLSPTSASEPMQPGDILAPLVV